MRKNRLFTTILVLAVVCYSIFVYPTVESTAATCNHEYTYGTPRQFYFRDYGQHTAIDAWYDEYGNKHILGPEQCTYVIDYWIVSIYCSSCGAYLGDSIEPTTPYNHSVPWCRGGY